ncbi:signal peptidase complex subunit 1 [Nematocida sp. LUAm3]|nr:signal peptidase complex subunit 1 [Nematocida sp. LUAm3]KAI5173502.1 signal peptidase complex subunit 1 [Nematocida sp. LUAm2]KAI5176694.1 signal peptidase complex subunit 1 [Nematocida sp. LUAm1]
MWLFKRIDAVSKKINPQVDYIGQELGNRILHCILIIGMPISLIIGVASSNMFYLLYSLAAVVLIAFIAVVPAWPMYRRYPVHLQRSKKE